MNLFQVVHKEINEKQDLLLDKLSSGTIKDHAEYTQLPAPQGYRVLCAVPDIDDTFDNGIIKTTETIKTEEILATVLFVVELGPDCYKDIDKFPSGPYCKKGDLSISL